MYQLETGSVRFGPSAERLETRTFSNGIFRRYATLTDNGTSHSGLPPWVRSGHTTPYRVGISGLLMHAANHTRVTVEI